MTEPANEQLPTSAEKATEDAAPATPPSRAPWVLRGVVSALLTVSILLLIAGRTYLFESLEALPASSVPESAEIKKELRDLESKAKRSRATFSALAPQSVYIVVDSARNKLYVKRGEDVLHEAACSTGSGSLLKDPKTDRDWIFDTPRGKFRVIRKAQDPVWTKPDWAFVEEGKPIPEAWSERRDYDTLGDYALYFGDGFMIHGTLYQRYLGRSITHGCIRLGDDDLERVYRLTPVGAPIFIF
ncbi:MAG TPA: L,D-transpeptidase [Vicinamibacteria bacterium]|nr:L,D-transpeptidase [Vicinamibacteria bacterium]